MIRLTHTQDQAIRNHGATEFPLECCGVLLGEVHAGIKVVREVRPLPNEHEDERTRRFLIPPTVMRDLMAEEKHTGQVVLGFYHSHPNHPAIPSTYDRQWAWEWWTYIIVSVQDGVPTNMTAWQLDEDHSENFLEETIEIRDAGDTETLPTERRI